MNRAAAESGNMPAVSFLKAPAYRDGLAGYWENRTITVDFQDETTYVRLLDDGKAFRRCVLAFFLSLGLQLKHKMACGTGGCLTRHSHYVRVRLHGVPI